MARKYPQVGSMIQKKDKETGEAVLDANGKATYYIKLDSKTDIKINGVKVTGYLNISRPRDKFDRLLAAGKIDKAEHAEKVAQFEKGGKLDYIQFELGATIEE